MKARNFFSAVKLGVITGLAALAMTSGSFAAQLPEQQSTSNNVLALTRQVEKSRINACDNFSDSNSERTGDFYIGGGLGIVNPGGDTGPRYIQICFSEHLTPRLSLGCTYINEGHPDLNEAGHRDGFALMGLYEIPVLNKLRLEAGVGPYFNMNTTWRGNNFEQEFNDKGIGLLATLALIYPISDSGLNIRAQINEVIMPGSFSTTALLLGVGTELGGKLNDRQFSKGQNGNYAINVLAGPCQTTRAGKVYNFGGKIELQRKISDRFAWSVSGISEGDSGVSSRKGFAGQGWFVTPKLGRLEFSAGLGPYGAQESNEDDKGIKILGLATMRAKIDIAKGYYGLAEFNRAISTYDKDEDMFLFGVGKKF
jgi:hypothetical protein